MPHSDAFKLSVLLCIMAETSTNFTLSEQTCRKVGERLGLTGKAVRHIMDGFRQRPILRTDGTIEDANSAPLPRLTGAKRKSSSTNPKVAGGAKKRKTATGKSAKLVNGGGDRDDAEGKDEDEKWVEIKKEAGLDQEGDDGAGKQLEMEAEQGAEGEKSGEGEEQGLESPAADVVPEIGSEMWT